mmetsp:Transcript_106295/g.305614  ORF Transcript_106295/g.305614 Transcript_106295/m.305614 type:complete len:332 (-) Transcript_106295:13-1008(-)
MLQGLDGDDDPGGDHQQARQVRRVRRDDEQREPRVPKVQKPPTVCGRRHAAGTVQRQPRHVSRVHAGQSLGVLLLELLLAPLEPGVDPSRDDPSGGQAEPRVRGEWAEVGKHLFPDVWRDDRGAHEEVVTAVQEGHEPADPRRVDLLAHRSPIEQDVVVADGPLHDRRRQVLRGLVDHGEAGPPREASAPGHLVHDTDQVAVHQPRGGVVAGEIEHILLIRIQVHQHGDLAAREGPGQLVGTEVVVHVAEAVRAERRLWVGVLRPSHVDGPRLVFAEPRAAGGRRDDRLENNRAEGPPAWHGIGVGAELALGVRRRAACESNARRTRDKND